MKFPKAISVLLIMATTAAEVVGKARVIDGSTLEVGGRTVRLYGIDAPSEAQSCTQDGKTWPCGREASFALVSQVGNHWLTCEEKGRDSEDRILALCRVGGKDLGCSRYTCCSYRNRVLTRVSVLASTGSQEASI